MRNECARSKVWRHFPLKQSPQLNWSAWQNAKAKSEPSVVYDAAKAALLRIGGPLVVSALVKALPYDETAADLLCNIGGTEAKAGLEQALRALDGKYGEPERRAARALGSALARVKP